MKRRFPIFAILLLILLALLLHSIYGQSFIAAIILGCVLIVVGIVGIIKAPGVWSNYFADYKKLPAVQKKHITKPNKRYYYINRYILFPLIIVVGIFSWYVAYLIYTINYT